MRNTTLALPMLGVTLLASAALMLAGRSSDAKPDADPKAASVKSATPISTDSVTLSREQSRQIAVVPVTERSFVPRRDAVGVIDFDQDRSVQVFSQYTGRVRQVMVKAGDDVRRDQPLFSIDSPDLISAESGLVSSAAALDLTNRAIQRLRKMVEVQAAAQKDLDQAVADQQTAEGSYQAARDAVRLFGKSSAEIDAMVANRKLDGELVVRSPIAGRITARNLAPGLLVQPGATPAPLVVSDLSVMWLIANLQEVDIPLLRKGAPVEVSVPAYPGRVFKGELSYLGEAIDPNTHRLLVRSDIRDPQHQLRPQMLATYHIQAGAAVTAPVIPQNGLVREGDGSFAVFVTSDGLTFKRRQVRLGMTEGDQVQLLEGVSVGDKVAAEGALFLANALALQTR